MPITEAEFKKLLETENMIGGDQKSSMIALYIILYHTGRRISEILDLKKDDVVITDDEVIMNFINLKMRKRVMQSRTDLVLSRSLLYMDYLVEYFKRAKDQLITNQYFNFSRFTVNEHLEKASNAMGSKYPLYPHLFRHTKVSLFRKMGYTDTDIVSWFGWSDNRPLNKYGDRPINRIREMGKA